MCSKQIWLHPAMEHRADWAPLKSMGRLSVKAAGFGSDAKSIIITLWLIPLIPVLSSNPLTEREKIWSLLVKAAAKQTSDRSKPPLWRNQLSSTVVQKHICSTPPEIQSNSRIWVGTGHCWELELGQHSAVLRIWWGVSWVSWRER